MSKITLDVNIMGQIYTLACPVDEQAALMAAVREVDAEMCAIRDKGKVHSRERIAVLAALNLAHSLIEARQAARVSPAAHSGTQTPALGTDDIQALNQLTRQLDEALSAEGKLL